MQHPITMTRELLNKAKTEAGGYRKHQLELIGVPWPPKKGWLDSYIGKQITNKAREAPSF